MIQQLQNLETQIIEFCKQNNATDILVSPVLGAALKSCSLFKTKLEDVNMEELIMIGTINDTNVIVDQYLPLDCMNVYLKDKTFFTITGIDIECLL